MACEVHTIVGFRSKDIVILEDEFKAVSDKMVMMTDDGTYGTKGLVTAGLEELILAGEKYDEVIAIGPVIMMKFVCQVTKKYDIKTVDLHEPDHDRRYRHVRRMSSYSRRRDSSLHVWMVLILTDIRLISTEAMCSRNHV